jgi:hypothetical protein
MGSGSGSGSGPSPEDLDALFDTALEASVNMDLTLLHLNGPLDDLMDGLGFGPGANSAGPHGGGDLGGAAGGPLDLSIPKNFSFSDLSQFDIGGWA